MAFSTRASWLIGGTLAATALFSLGPAGLPLAKSLLYGALTIGGIWALMELPPLFPRGYSYMSYNQPWFSGWDFGWPPSTYRSWGHGYARSHHVDSRFEAAPPRSAPFSGSHHVDRSFVPAASSFRGQGHTHVSSSFVPAGSAHNTPPGAQHVGRRFERK